MKIKQAVFFDLDGTLWNAIPQLVEAYNIAMEKNNEPYRFDYEKVRSYMGLTPEETCPLAFPGTSLQEGLALFKKCYDEELVYLQEHPGNLYPNVIETLEELKKDYPLYIVSNADKGYIEGFLKSLNLGYLFNGFIQAGDTNLPKWKNILLLKEKEDIEEVVYVGDTYKDMYETKLAGQKFIHASYGFGPINEPCSKVKEFKELPLAIKKEFNK